MTDDILLETAERMQRAVAHAREEFTSVRTGRASPSLIEKLTVEYYGADVPLQQIAGFTVPEARLLVVQPYDKQSIGAIERAIQQSSVGLNPSNDGSVIRLVFPQLTAERRKELVRVVKGMAEDAKVAVRNARRHARQALEALERDGDASADDVERAAKELEKVTQDYVAEIDAALEAKEKELLEV